MLMLSAVPSWAQSPPTLPPAHAESPEFRARLEAAAADPTLEPWQREFMRGMVGTGEARGAGDAIPGPLGTADASGDWDLLPTLTARYNHSAIYDPVRDRMVIFGGRGESGYLNDVWALNLTGTPAWSALSPTGTPPTARQYHTAIYDPVRDRMVIFGGSWDNLGWALSLAGTPAWSELSPTGTPPAGRAYHTAIYDPVRDRMVAFAGYDGSSYSNDVWALSLSGTPAWSALIPTSTAPVARWQHTAIYDPVRDRMVVFAGWDSGPRNDVWVFSLSGTPAWSSLSPTGIPPPARGSHTALYDPVRDRMVVFGGYDGGYRNDAWALSLSGTPAWSALVPTGTPPTARAYHTAIYDPVRDRMLVFGGWDQSHTYRNDVWALSLSGPPAWSVLSPTGTPPTARQYHTAIYDPVRDRMIAFGGYDDTVRRNDVWALSLSGAPAWSALSPTGTPPIARYGHTAIYDPVRDRMVVFAGVGGSLLDDAWALSLSGPPGWSMLVPTGTPPTARYAHMAIYDPVRDRMVVFAGSDYSLRNDVYQLNWSSLVAVDPSVPQVTLRFELAPPRPNPSRGNVSFDLSIPHASPGSLVVYDSAGRVVHRVADASLVPGRHVLVWDRRNDDGRVVPSVLIQ
jgi:hypothetical protein